MESLPEPTQPKASKKWKSMVRVKPLMDDEIISINEKEKDKRFNGVQGNTVSMIFSRGEEKFEFDKVILDSEDQENAFNSICGDLI